MFKNIIYFGKLQDELESLLLNSDVPDQKFKVRPEPDPDFFFQLRSGRIRISDKNGNIRPYPEPDS